MKEKFPQSLKQKFNSLLNVAKQTLPSLKWHFLIFIFLYLFVIILWKIPQLQVPVSDITNKERFQLENEARKTLAQVLGGTILLVGIYLTWRRIRATERTVEVAQEGQIQNALQWLLNN